MNALSQFFSLTQNSFIGSILKRSSNSAYKFSSRIVDGLTRFNDYGHEKRKLSAVLSNPALLKVFALQCDLFSMGEVVVLDDKDKEIEDDPFLSFLDNPNPFQSKSQFLWDFMFWNMLGNTNILIDSKIVDKKGNKAYYLEPSKIIWPEELKRESDKMIFSDATLKSRDKMIVGYRYADGSVHKFTLDKLLTVTDLTNGVGNFYKGTSRIDALYKVISNSEFALDAKNINVRYTSKFLVGSSNDTSKLGLSEDEKNDIETKVDTMDKQVWAVKTPVNIRRFIDNLANLQLDQAYLADYFLVGSMYGIPRDVLEAYNSATYENQEKARAAHVNYCLDPKGNQFMDSFEKFFGYDQIGKNIRITWSHLPFMQVFEKEKADVAKVKIDSLTSLLSLGVDIKQINQFLGTEFKIKEKKEEPKPAAVPQGNGEGEQEQAGASEEDEGASVEEEPVS